MTISLSKEPMNYGKVITTTCFSIQAIGVGVYVSYGVFFNPLMDEFGWSRASLSGASSLAFFITGLFGILIGRLNDNFGPRILMGISAVFFGLGLCLMSQVSTLFQLYLVFGLIFGIGLSSVDVIALSTIARWFALKRGKMTGIVKMGTGAGQFTFPILASFLIAGFGWKHAFIIMGFSALILLLIIAQFLRRDPDSFYHPSAGTPRELTKSQNQGFSFSRAWKTPELWIICLVNLLLVYCLMSIIMHIVPHTRDIGISPHKAASVLSTIGAVSIVGRFISGIAIDRTGSKQIMRICFGFLLISLLWLPKADALWKLYGFACIYGIAHGGFFTAISPIMVELFGIRAHGSLFGVVACFGATGGALGPICTGYLFDRTHNYTAAFWLILIISCISFGLLLCLRTRPRAA
ncbi:MFS transporter [Desulfobacula sp.]|uniref:MFS transporter n=1 Tax=Desulfobacula sp. TaxID=2593537 RepID=UPI00261A29EF|nr:MFS transporter [Desulfobacula sp.]